MRGVAILLISAALFCPGLLRCQSILQQKRELEGYLRALELLQNELRFHHTPLSKAFAFVSLGSSGTVRTYFQELQSSAETMEPSLSYSLPVGAVPLPIAQMFSSTDLEAELNLIRSVQAQTEQKLKEVSISTQQRCSAALSAGAALSALGAILLI